MQETIPKPSQRARGCNREIWAPQALPQLGHIPQHRAGQAPSHSVGGRRGLAPEGKAFLQGTARQGTRILCPLSAWEDAATLVTQAKGRLLGLAALSLAGPAKSPHLAAPCPQDCSRSHWHPGCGVGAAKAPQNGLWQETASPTVPLGSFPMAQPVPRCDLPPQ